MPCLLNAETGDNEDGVEDIEEQTLGLPSDFTRDTITHHCLKELASVELELRKGEAYDALWDVRSALSHQLQLSVQISKHSRGSVSNTHAKTLCTEAAKLKSRAVQHYNDVHSAILSLDVSSDFRPLTQADLVTKDIDTGTALGGGRKTDGWIWTFGVREGECNGEWEEDGKTNSMPFIIHNSDTLLVRRVCWFRAKADMERWKEEVHILRAEMKCTSRTFTFLSDAWKAAGVHRGPQKAGYLAYALERSDMYSIMASRCKEELEKVGG